LVGSPANLRRPISKKDFELIIEELRKPPTSKPTPAIEEVRSRTHTEIQGILLQLGTRRMRCMGCKK